MENTASNKADFLRQYMLSYNCFEGISNSLWYLIPCTIKGCQVDLGNRGVVSVKDAPPLELKHVKNISEEDAIEVGKIITKGMTLSKDFNIALHGRLYVGDFKKQSYKDSVQEVVDFLRKKSYAVPYLGLSVGKMIEYKWLILK